MNSIIIVMQSSITVTLAIPQQCHNTAVVSSVTGVEGGAVGGGRVAEKF